MNKLTIDRNTKVTSNNIRDPKAAHEGIIESTIFAIFKEFSASAVKRLKNRIAKPKSKLPSVIIKTLFILSIKHNDWSKQRRESVTGNTYLMRPSAWLICYM